MGGCLHWKVGFWECFGVYWQCDLAFDVHDGELWRDFGIVHFMVRPRIQCSYCP